MLSSVATGSNPETRSLQQIQLGHSYDQNGQLTGASSLEDLSLNESFSYDPLGNRLTDKYGNYIYDTKKQRLQEDSQYLYLYDNNGNILYRNSKDSAKVSYKYEYSSTNQLKSIKVLQKTLSSPLGEVIKEVSFKYDVLGRRVRKDVIDHLNTSDITKNYKVSYIYQGDNIAVELDANDNVVIAQHFHSPLKPDDILKSSYTSRAKDLGFVKNPGVFTYIKDHLGTVTELVDNSGDVKQRYNYTNYGVLRAISSGDGSQDIMLNPEVKPYFTYTGREWDSEVELFYYRARYYDANTGRFLQKDPDPGKLKNPTTFLSKYIYANNNSIMMNDPTGRLAWFIPIIIGALIGATIGAIDATINGGNFLEKTLQGALAGVLYGAAFALNPTIALVGIGTAVANASSRRENFFASLNKNGIKSGAMTLAGALAINEIIGLAEVPGLGMLFEGAAAQALTIISYVAPAASAIMLLDDACNSEKGSWARGDICSIPRNNKR